MKPIGTLVFSAVPFTFALAFEPLELFPTAHVHFEMGLEITEEFRLGIFDLVAVTFPRMEGRVRTISLRFIVYFALDEAKE